MIGSVYPLATPILFCYGGFFFKVDLNDANWWREEKPSASPHMVGKGGAEPEPLHLFTPGWNQVRQLMRLSGSAPTCWRQRNVARLFECWRLGEEIPARDICVGRQEGCSARKTKRNACTESSAPRNRERCRFNKGLMTLKLSLVASIKTGDFINRERKHSCPANGRNSSSGG